MTGVDMKMMKWMMVFAAVGLTIALSALVGCESAPSYSHLLTSSHSERAYRMSTPGPAESLGLAGTVNPRGTSGVSVVRFNPDEEILIIVTKPDAEWADPDSPGCGALMVPGTDGGTDVPVPLAHTDVSAQIDGFIAQVGVTQRFTNPFDQKIEAVYVFPLPQNAAIREFVMTIGDRRIRGILRERAQAEAIYRSARDQGFRASLMTQARPNIFTQRVANIEPGESIEVAITYFNSLRYENGEHEFVFPMVVGPRYNPPGSVGGIGAVGRETVATSGTNVPYLRPTERSGHDISLAVELRAGVSIENVRSDSHLVRIDHHGAADATITLSPLDAIPNRDFRLRWRVSGAEPKASVVAHRGADGQGHFALMVYPPEGRPVTRRVPVELTFVIDVSGSMNGRPMEQAKRAVVRALQRLEPDDTFRVIRFSSSATSFAPATVRARPDDVLAAIRWVEATQAGGGTEMMAGMRAALTRSSDRERSRHVIFLTDGYIGNEADVLRVVHDRLHDQRIFSFGIGSSPNRYLMNRMAKLGRGAATYLSLNTDAAQVMDLFLDRVQRPMLTDVALDFSHLPVFDVTPGQLPDVMAGRPLLVTGRFTRPEAGTIVLRGRRGNEAVEMAIEVNFNQASAGKSVASIWARRRITELADRRAWDRDDSIASQILGLALSYSLMSEYTAFVAVDASERTQGEHGTTVGVPVPTPVGVRYDTTVGGWP